MAIDPNEIQGFIGSCTNDRFLIQLAWAIQDQLRLLGKPGLGLRRPDPVPGNVKDFPADPETVA